MKTKPSLFAFILFVALLLTSSLLPLIFLILWVSKGFDEASEIFARFIRDILK